MDDRYELLDVDLTLFDGGGGDGATGGTQAGPAGTQQGKTGGGAANAAPKDGSDAGSGQQAKTETPEERAARYKALVGGEFKDLYTADTQRIIDQRFKETRGLRESLAAQQPVMDFLTSKYQTKDPKGLMAAIQADESQWQAMADAAGKTVEQFRSDYLAQRQRQELEAELRQTRQERFYRQQLDAWSKEAEEVKKTYPDFDLAREMEEDKSFEAMLRLRVPMKRIYESKHYPELVAGAANAAATERERAVTEAIKARGSRPAENGASAQNGVTTVANVSQMTREQRAEIAKRVARGEKVTFR